jgi:hypothetical protein
MRWLVVFLVLAWSGLAPAGAQLLPDLPETGGEAMPAEGEDAAAPGGEAPAPPAQQPPQTDEPDAGDADAPLETDAPLEEAMPDISGDTLVLTTGKTLESVQVVRRLASGYLVEIVEGSVTVEIPVTQVERIEYDDYEPLRERRERRLAGAGPAGQQVVAQPMSPQLGQKLTQSVSDRELIYNQDVLAILSNIEERKGIAIAVDPAISEWPLQERRWEVRVPPDKTVSEFLTRDLVDAFPRLDVEVGFNEIRISLREEPAPNE